MANEPAAEMQEQRLVNIILVDLNKREIKLKVSNMNISDNF